jgi:hypothetical protein
MRRDRLRSGCPLQPLPTALQQQVASLVQRPPHRLLRPLSLSPLLLFVPLLLLLGTARSQGSGTAKSRALNDGGVRVVLSLAGTCTRATSTPSFVPPGAQASPRPEPSSTSRTQSRCHSVRGALKEPRARTALFCCLRVRALLRRNPTMGKRKGESRKLSPTLRVSR